MDFWMFLCFRAPNDWTSRRPGWVYTGALLLYLLSFAMHGALGIFASLQPSFRRANECLFNGHSDWRTKSLWDVRGGLLWNQAASGCVFVFLF